MLSFKAFITENVVLTEGAEANRAGVMHEILTGYHLMGGKHMSKHHSVYGDSPEEAHDKLKATMHPDEYNRINAGAKAAAHHIQHTVLGGSKIHDVHWTSKPGDIERSTGVKASQSDDAADIVIHHGEKKIHGVSLKVTGKSSGSVPLANRGLNDELAPGLKKLHDDHKAEIKRDHPTLAANSNKSKRKEWAASNKEEAQTVKDKNTAFMGKAIDHLHKHLDSIPKSELADHIRKHVLASRPTALQNAGHSSIVHTTYSNSKGGHTHGHTDPSQAHADKLADHKNITVHRSGNGLIFKHNGITFARQHLKTDSRSDPMSSFKAIGTKAGKTTKT